MRDSAPMAMNKLAQTRSYLLVTHQDDGRYRVEFRKDGQLPRISYTTRAELVAQQALRAGNIPVCTSDAELQQVCRERQIALIAGSPG